MTRSDPFTLIFGEIAEKHFPLIRDQLEQNHVDVHNRDQFVLLGAVGTVLQEMVSAETPPEAVGDHAALLHHAYRYWDAERPLLRVDRATLTQALGEPGTNVRDPLFAYAQLPERHVWAEVTPGAPHQPLDGFFLVHTGGTIDLLAVFGLHQARHGFDVVSVTGPSDEATLATEAQRSNGSAPFSPLLPGGAAAGLLSVATTAELLLLARRVAGFLAPAPNTG